MKKNVLFAAFALLATSMTLPLVSCGGDDDDDNGGKSKFETQTFTVGGVSLKMIAVEGGTFQMGAPDDEENSNFDEKPQHDVKVSDFYMGETEVTQALWEAVMNSNPSSFIGDNQPVDNVSWNDCQTFITKLNGMLKAKLGGKKFRLPTEAEWEYAARGGKASYPFTYSGSDNLDLVAWYVENSGNKAHPVGTKTMNALGLYDMSGNVWEWCSDWYGENYYSSSPQTNPSGPATGTERVFRGGCWNSYLPSCRVAYRGVNKPDRKSYSVGLRLAMSK